MQHTSCNALGRVGPLFSGTGVPLGPSTGKDGPNRPRVGGEHEGRSPENCGAPHGRYPLLLDARLWYPRAHTLARPPKGGGLVCGEMFISRAGAEPAAGLAPRLGTASQLGQARASAGAPALGALGAMRAGTTQSVSDERRAHRCSSAPSRLGSPPGGSDPRCSGLSERGYASERLRLTVRSARLAALASVPARRQPNLSRRDCLQLPHPALGLRRSPFGHGMPLGPGRPPPRRRRPVPRHLRAREGAAPPQMPLRGRVSPVDGLSGPRQYRD